MDLPARIGRYDIVRLLGQGGMGRVLLARDSVLGRSVAIKVLRDDLALPPESKEALFARMRQEARAAAALEHPHMVTLHDMGEEAPHGLYLVFEYIEGPTLRDRITAGSIALGDIARMARELGDALTAAHEAGVIHRDVKPENVLLSKHGAKLTDFGIARMPDSTLTSAGSVLGTPAYSAPEALALADFSPLSDQFSLAVTMYEAISGKRAFPGEDALTIATRIATEPAPPLPFIQAASDPRIVNRMDAVLTRAMTKDPQRRYASCRELGEALAVAIETRNETIISEIPAPLSIVPRQTRRIQNIIAAGALLLIVGLLLLGRRSEEGTGVSLRRASSAFAATLASAQEHERPAVATPPPRPRPTPAARADAGAPLNDAAAPPLPAPSADASSPSPSPASGPGGAIVRDGAAPETGP
jgi:serine/threonine-protein kinase